jgi:hypothetical protein
MLAKLRLALIERPQAQIGIKVLKKQAGEGETVRASFSPAFFFPSMGWGVG